MSKYELSLSDIPFPDTTIIERQFIADAVDNPDEMPDFTGIVDETMFTNENRVYLWKTIVWMFQNGQAINLSSVVARTGNYYIKEILQKNYYPASPLGAIQHAAELRAAAIRRRAYFSAVKLLETVTKPGTDELSVFEGAQQILMDIQGDTRIVTEEKLSDVLDAVDKEIAENKANNASGVRTRIATGFPSLDARTYGGWSKGQLIILAARPSVGKTAVMLQMAKAAAKSSFPAAIFSLEMTKEELGKRLLFSTGLVTPIQIVKGDVDARCYEDARKELNSMKISINDESRTLAGILSRITSSVSQGKCKIAFIDYLGLIDIDETNRTPLNQQLAKATKALKHAAKRNGIPIVLLCQLNRQSVQEDRPPELFHLRDSGSIEQDADIVLMLEQKAGTAIKSTPGEGKEISPNPYINIWIRKNRQFKRDECISVQPNETYSRFTEMAVSDEMPLPESVAQPPSAKEQEEDQDLPF